MEKILTQKEKAEAFDKILNRNGDLSLEEIRIFIKSLSKLERAGVLKYSEDMKGQAKEFVERLRIGNPQMSSYEYMNHNHYRDAVTVIEAINSTIEPSSKAVKHLQKTRYENEFFSITEKFCFVLDEKGNTNFEPFNYELFNNVDEFKAEIIENITALSANDREYYLNRILNRLNKIEEGFFTIDETGQQEPLGLRATVEGETNLSQIEIEPARIQAYYNMIKSYKTQMLEFLNSLMPQQTEAVSKDESKKQSAGTYYEIISKISNRENKFWKGMPLDVVIKHFEAMTTKKNKNGEPYLSQKQFISFLKKGFLIDETQPKQKIRCSAGEKGFVIKRFYEFYALAVGEYGYPAKTDKFIKLFTDCFDNWNPETIKPFFKKDKTKENW